jgi:hypothetical protein
VKAKRSYSSSAWTIQKIHSCGCSWPGSSNGTIETPIEALGPGEYNELKDALHAHIAARANQGRPFTNSSQPPNGILNKANLERLVHNDTRIGSKDDITNLIDSLAIDQKIRFVKEGNSLWIKPA